MLHGILIQPYRSFPALYIGITDERSIPTRQAMSRPENHRMPDYADVIVRLVRYEVWCNRQAMAFLAGLSEEEVRRDFGFGLRTPHRTMFHIADVMQGWGSCVGPVIVNPMWLEYDEEMTLREIDDLLASAGEALLTAAKSAHERGILGDERRLDHLLHLVTHGTHHRGQLLSMITLMGYDQPFEGGDFGGWVQSPDR
jgi:uncharacterized damage-inducible protein DinB